MCSARGAQVGGRARDGHGVGAKGSCCLRSRLLLELRGHLDADALLIRFVYVRACVCV